MAQLEGYLPEEELESSPSEAGDFLPDPAVSAPARVPRNVAEIAAQIAMAVDGDNAPFEQRFGTAASRVEAEGIDGVLGQLFQQELDDQIQAAKEQANQFARRQDVEGAAFSARLAADIEARRTTPPHPVVAHRAMVARALEAVDPTNAPRAYPDLAIYGRKLDEVAGDVATRNIIAQEAAGLSPSIWDMAKKFATDLIPFADKSLTARAINKVLGTNFLVDDMAAVNALRNYLLGLHPEERKDVIRAVVDNVGPNPAEKASILRKLAELTKEESLADFGGQGIQAVDVGAIIHAIGSVARKGTPVRAVKEIAGEKAAGDLVASDLITKAGITGLNDAELVSSALAAGRLPLADDPAALAGLAPHVQAKLKERWDTMLASIKERLNSSGMTPEEVKEAAARIRASYMPETNKRVYSVQFGEASEDGQKLTVFWQRADGTPFPSKEAALEEAKDRGLPSFKVVPKNMAEAAFKGTAGRSRAAVNFKEELKNVKAQLPKLNEMERALKQRLKEMEKSYTDFDGDYLYQRFDVTQQLKAIKELKDNIKTIKNYNDVEDWFAHYEAVVGEKPVLSRSPILTVEGLRRKPLGEVKAGLAFHYENSDDVGRLVLDQYAEGLSRGYTQISAARVLRTLADNSPDVVTRTLAQILLDRPGVLWDRLPVSLEVTPPRVDADYIPARDRVRLSIERGIDEETLLHELIHAHNTQVISLALYAPKEAAKVLSKKQIQAAKELDVLRNKLLDWVKTNKSLPSRDKAALKKVLEFPDEVLAYGLTNEQVRGLFATLSLREVGFNQPGGVLDKLWQLFKEIFGIEGIDAADDSVLAKVTELFGRINDDLTEARRTVISRGVKSGQLPESSAEAILSSAWRAHSPEPVEWLIREERTDPLSYDFVGKFSKEDIESMPHIAVDPKHGASELAVESRVVGVHAEAKTRKALIDYITPYYTKLSKEGKQRVASLLEEGDSFSNGGDVGKEFTYMEARAKGLSDDEAQAYLATRSLRMAMWHIRNAELTRHLRAQGFKEIVFTNGFRTPGKVLTLESAQSWIGRDVYDAAAKKMVSLDEAGMAAAYESGKRIVRLAKPMQLDGETRQVMLLDKSVAKSQDITKALAYRPGEYSRIYTDEYFITMKRNIKVDGKLQEVTETVRTAASAREAAEFVDAVRKAVAALSYTGPLKVNINRTLERLVGKYFDIEEFKSAFNAGEFDGFQSIDFHYTRNKEEYLNGSVAEAISNGRLFTSKRSERLLSTDRARKNTLGVFESLEAEITNISRVANINQWRETMVRRWMNTFGHLLPQRTGDDVADFFSAAGATFTKGTQEALFAERTHRYIMRQIGVKTAEEQYYANLTRRITEKWFSGSEPLETVGAKIRKAGVLNFIRAMNFNLILGMFNPAQIIVQANGASAAMILHPLYGLNAAKTAPLLRMALMSDNPQVHRFFAKVEKAASLGLSNEDEFVQLVGAVRKAGILDNLKSTALWNSEEGRLNIFNGFPSRVLGHHTFFFNRGEEFARLVSFDVARREWMAANPGADWTRPEVLKNLVVRMDDLTQNMTKANLARFQEGIVSIPLQFAQYNIKLATNVVTAIVKGGTRGFTRAEAAWLMAGHILLYGAAGNGLMWLVEEILTEEQKEGLSDEWKIAIGQGLLGSLVASLGEMFTGERTAVAVSSRLGAFDYYQKLVEALFTDPKNIYEALMGPTLGTARRLGVIGDVAYLWWKDPNVTLEEVMRGLAAITVEQASSLRNAAKAYLYHQHGNKLLDSKGVAIAQLTTPEILAQALGFQPLAAEDVHNLIKSKKEHNQALKEIADTIYKVQKDIMAARMRGDHKYADELHLTLQALWPENSGDMMEVQRLIRDRLFPYDNEFQKLLADYAMKGHTYSRPLIQTPRN